MEYDIVTTKHFYKKGTKILHREDGPAVEVSDGYNAYWINGKRHRVDGPAVKYHNGNIEWWVDGKMLPLEKQHVLDKWWNNKNGI